MSNIRAGIALALLLAATPTASFARTAGEAGAGNLSVGDIPPGPANVGDLNTAYADPSGNGNAARMSALQAPHLGALVVPQFR